MTPQQIKDGMTKGEWVIDTLDGAIIANEIEEICNPVYLNVEQKEIDANSLVITTAVNATYNKGYNPEAMEDCVKALEKILNNYKPPYIPDGVVGICKDAITKAKL